MGIWHKYSVGIAFVANAIVTASLIILLAVKKPVPLGVSVAILNFQFLLTSLTGATLVAEWAYEKAVRAELARRARAAGGANAAPQGGDAVVPPNQADPPHHPVVPPNQADPPIPVVVPPNPLYPPNHMDFWVGKAEAFVIGFSILCYHVLIIFRLFGLTFSDQINVRISGGQLVIQLLVCLLLSIKLKKEKKRRLQLNHLLPRSMPLVLLQQLNNVHVPPSTPSTPSTPPLHPPHSPSPPLTHSHSPSPTLTHSPTSQTVLPPHQATASSSSSTVLPPHQATASSSSSASPIPDPTLLTLSQTNLPPPHDVASSSDPPTPAPDTTSLTPLTPVQTDLPPPTRRRRRRRLRPCLLRLHPRLRLRRLRPRPPSANDDDVHNLVVCVLMMILYLMAETAGDAGDEVLPHEED